MTDTYAFEYYDYILVYVEDILLIMKYPKGLCHRSKRSLQLNFQYRITEELTWS